MYKSIILQLLDYFIPSGETSLQVLERKRTLIGVSLFLGFLGVLWVVIFDPSFSNSLSYRYITYSSLCGMLISPFLLKFTNSKALSELVTIFSIGMVHLGMVNARMYDDGMGVIMSGGTISWPLHSFCAGRVAGSVSCIMVLIFSFYLYSSGVVRPLRQPLFSSDITWFYVHVCYIILHFIIGWTYDTYSAPDFFDNHSNSIFFLDWFLPKNIDFSNLSRTRRSITCSLVLISACLMYVVMPPLYDGILTNVFITFSASLAHIGAVFFFGNDHLQILGLSIIIVLWCSMSITIIKLGGFSSLASTNFSNLPFLGFYVSGVKGGILMLILVWFEVLWLYFSEHSPESIGNYQLKNFISYEPPLVEKGPASELLVNWLFHSIISFSVGWLYDNVDRGSTNLVLKSRLLLNEKKNN